MATFSLSVLPKTLTPQLHHKPSSTLAPTFHVPSPWTCPHPNTARSAQFRPVVVAAGGGEQSSKRSSNNNEPRETILLPGCDYNHWLIVMEFPKDPAPTRDQMIETYLDTLASVLGSMEEAKKNMYAFSTTTYTGFQCTVDEETSEKFKGLPGVLWVLPDSYIDVKNKDYGGDKYVNGEIIPCTYPTYQPKQRNSSKSESRRYERRKDGPPSVSKKWTRQSATASESAPTSAPTSG